jgi:hypothetical protein
MASRVLSATGGLKGRKNYLCVLHGEANLLARLQRKRKKRWQESLTDDAPADSDFGLWMLYLNQDVFQQENMSVWCAEKS